MPDPAEPPVRVMALHALAYCERLFYLEEVEELRVANARVYAGRALHAARARAEEDAGEWTSVELAGEALGLVGKADCLKRRDGALIPYEHKRGRAKRDGKTAVAWPADALQVAAYGLLLEEALGVAVPEGRIRYHADNVTVRVPLDDAARRSVRDAVARARELRRAVDRPPVTDNDRLCAHCSLAPVCLPEEERFVQHRTARPVRLFPAAPEARTLHVVEAGARVSRSAETLQVRLPDGEKIGRPIHDVEAIVLHGAAQITTQALHLCAAHDVPVHWLSAAGRYVAGLAVGAPAVQRRIRQYRALADDATRLRLARRLAMAKAEGALRYVLRATRGVDRAAAGLDRPIADMRSALKAMAAAADPDALRGHEGYAGRAYFAAFPRLLRAEVPDALRPDGRSRRPPKDRGNALLSFGYALLYQAVLQAVLGVGLEPALGFFHTPRSAAHPLVLDLMELFRVPVWDVTVVGSLNRLQWEPDADFDVAGERVWLSAAGRRKAIQLFERRLQEHWRHPVIRYSLSYGRHIELEARLLEKEWSGEPGLFACTRLR